MCALCAVGKADPDGLGLAIDARHDALHVLGHGVGVAGAVDDDALAVAESS